MNFSFWIDRRAGTARPFNESLRKQLIENGRTKEKGVTNNLADSDVITVIQTLEFLGGDARRQISFDLHFAKYKVYYALGIWLQSRLSKSEQPREDNENIFVALANA